MAEISILSRLIDGMVKNVDLSSNTLVVNELKIGSSVLTSTNLATLIGGSSDASTLHNHDGRYFTETELGSVGNGTSGASLIGVDQDPAFTNISGANVQAIIESIDTALGSAGGAEFLDSTFRIKDNTTDTKKIAFEASGITADTTRTITMPDTNVNLGDIATNASNLSSHTGNTSNPHSVTKSQVLSGNLIVNADVDAAAAIVLSKLATVTASRALVSDGSGLISASSITATELGYLSGVSSAIQSQINSLESGYNRRKAVISIIADNTQAPPTEVDGDRYILSVGGGAPHANWDGASAGDIVEFVTDTWVATTPSEGWVAYVDSSDVDALYVDDGTPAWELRNVQQSALANAKIWIGSAGGSAVEQSVSGVITLSNAGVTAFAAGAIVNADVNVAAAILESKLSLDYSTSSLNTAIGGKLTKTLADGSIFIGNVSNEATAQAMSGDVTISNAGVTAIGSSKVTNDMLAGSIATSKLSDSATIGEAVTFFGSTDLSASEAETLSDGSNADSLHKHKNLFISLTNNTGSQIDAGDVVALSLTVAGEIFLADASAIATCECIAGVAVANIDNSASGLIQIAGEATVNQTAAFDIGKRVYVSEIAGEGTKTSPSTANTVSYCLGGATATNKVLLQMYLVGVN